MAIKTSKVKAPDFRAALKTVKPDWLPGAPITDEEASAASVVLFRAKATKQADDDAAHDAALRAEIDGILSVSHISAPSGIEPSDVSEAEAFREHYLNAHAATLASDRAKIFAAVDGVLAIGAGALTVYTGGATMPVLLASLAPLVDAFKSFAVSGDFGDFENLEPTT